jgi:hypothetical protein
MSGAGGNRFFGGVILAWIALCSAGAAIAEPVDVRSTPIPLYVNNPREQRAGSLLYRGGLELSASDSRFGGWSDLAVSADGSEILAISDRGHWLKARLAYSESGDLKVLNTADITPMLDMSGKPLAGRSSDAEGLTLERPNDLAGPVVVSFERNVRVWRYDLSRGLAARPVNVPVGDWVKPLQGNAQLEAVTLVRPDALLVFGESKLEGEDIRAAFEPYAGKERPSTRTLSVIPHDPFSVTGAANAPDGGVFILERRYSLLGGVGMELRHVAATDLREGARLEGRVLVNLSFQDANIDNMEGITVRRGPNGETLLYMLSDDNFSPLQRTLLLMFELRR